jgi:hypothetical protein
MDCRYGREGGREEGRGNKGNVDKERCKKWIENLTLYIAKDNKKYVLFKSMNAELDCFSDTYKAFIEEMIINRSMLG